MPYVLLTVQGDTRDKLGFRLPSGLTSKWTSEIPRQSTIWRCFALFMLKTTAAGDLACCLLCSCTPGFL